MHPGRGAGKTLLIGSHLDTVRDAGRFDGALGVLLALAVAEMCGPLPFAIEVLGFIDEEGVRFQSTYLGSRALAGTLSPDDLAVRDADGVSLADAIRTFGGDPACIASERRDPATLLGYVEAHIEQGPVLEAADQPLAVVSGIAGQTRVRVTFLGESGHAGTVPMTLRHDALCGAAEFIGGVEASARENDGLIATVGEARVEPGASNVIPGRVRLSLDLRHANDASRARAVRTLEELAAQICARRGLQVEWEPIHETAAVACDAALTGRLAQSALECGGADLSAVAGQFRQQAASAALQSGAGHDAAALAALCPVAVLFVRCRGGVSHHPDEFASEEDIAAALAAMLRFLDSLAADHA